MFNPSERLERPRAQLLVVDVQDRLTPHIHGFDAARERMVLLVRAAGALHIPVTIAEQNPTRMGATDAAILEAASACEVQRLEKMTFSACGMPAQLQHFTRCERAHVLICGIEAHVCVQQSALDLLRNGLRPVLIADAVSSRRLYDKEIALERMRHAGVTVTTAESVIFELMYEAGTEMFRKVLPLLK